VLRQKRQELEFIAGFHDDVAMTIAQVEASTSSRLVTRASRRLMKGTRFAVDVMRWGISNEAGDDARLSRMDECISGDDPFDRKMDAPTHRGDVCKATVMHVHTEG
jgi:hypothetical protein